MSVSEQSAPSPPKTAAPVFSLDLKLSGPDWSQAKWGPAACRVPALIALLAGALELGQPAAGVVAGGAAFSVGLVGDRRIAGSSLAATLGTTALMALSAWAGTLSGGIEWLNLLVTMTWGLGFAFLSIHDDDSGWIAMQGMITLVIASAFPSHGMAALERSLAILAGGLTQIGLTGIFAWLVCLLRAKSKTGMCSTKAAIPVDYRWRDFFQSMKMFSAAWSYAIRVSLTVMLAVEVGRCLHIQNAYWLPMTTIIVLKPDFYRTYSGAVQRVTGTFFGVVLASLVAHLFRPTPEWLLLFVGLFSYAGFALVKVHPILFAAALTAYVVFLIACTGLPEAAITGHRLILTALGCALALVSRLIGYHRLVHIFSGTLETKDLHGA